MRDATWQIMFVVVYPPTVVSKVLLCRCISDQRGHVSSVHLSRGNLLLRRGHGSHVERVGASYWPRPHDARQCHRPVLNSTDPIKLLLEDGGPTNKQWLIIRHCQAAFTLISVNDGCYCYGNYWQPLKSTEQHFPIRNRKTDASGTIA